MDLGWIGKIDVADRAICAFTLPVQSEQLKYLNFNFNPNKPWLLPIEMERRLADTDYDWLSLYQITTGEAIYNLNHSTTFARLGGLAEGDRIRIQDYQKGCLKNWKMETIQSSNILIP